MEGHIDTWKAPIVYAYKCASKAISVAICRLESETLQHFPTITIKEKWMLNE